MIAIEPIWIATGLAVLLLGTAIKSVLFGHREYSGFLEKWVCNSLDALCIPYRVFHDAFNISGHIWRDLAVFFINVFLYALVILPAIGWASLEGLKIIA